ncbi:MAG: carotenoid 1,2-hydratase, partial [Gammaproteobacteria bacterium]|nr:lipocalin family protein [Gemmatimonadota bacterium]NIU73222.1 carotenoid 1,2-hydratase [Gammaproteobacteria bacterium]
SDQAGWDWFALQLSDGHDVMLYQMRRRDGTPDPWSSGTLVEPDGEARALDFAAGSLRPTGSWTST